jgi:hypothetical protein
MSKKAIWGIVIGAVLVVLIAVGIFVGMLVMAQTAGGDVQESFFKAVLSGDPKQVTALFDPAMNKEVDEPVLAQWMAAVKDNLGEFKGLSKTAFNTSVEYKNGAKIAKSSGTVNFEKGDATSELAFKDGKLIEFDVKSDKIPKTWFKGIAAGPTQLYQDRGKQFLTLFLSDKPDDAFAMMHENLQKVMPLEKLKALMADAAGKAGAVKSIQYLSEQVDPAGKLKILYKVECQKTTTTASVKFEQAGLKCHLVAFNINEKEE